MRALWSICLSCAACATTVDGPADPPLDALVCTSELPLVLGRCEQDSGDPCLGDAGEVRRFVPMSDGDRIAIVVGPQGSSMIVLAAGAFDIDPGDPDVPGRSGNPLLSLLLFDERGDELSRYQGRAGFTADPSGSSMVINPGIFVVIDDRLEEQTVEARAALRDAAGSERCGALRFVAARP